MSAITVPPLAQIASDSPEPDIVVVVLAAGAVIATALLMATLARRNRPRHPRPVPQTMELGVEPPAVVDLLTDDFVVTPEAVPATLLDLAARRWVEIDDLGGEVRVRLRRPPSGDQLTRYEERVLDHVRDRAVDGVVPARAMTTGPDSVADSWWRRFRREVVKDARRRGLCRRRWGLGQLALIWLSVILAGGVAYLAVVLGSDPDPAEVREGVSAAEGALILVFLGVAALAGMAGRFTRSEQQRDTDTGLERASYWLGVRAFLAEHPEFIDRNAAEVTVWERYLAHAAALDLAPEAVLQLPLGAEDDHHAWSRATGRWRQVRVRYPRLRPAWGEHPGRAVFAGLLRGAVAVGLIYAGLQVLGGQFDPIEEFSPDTQTRVELAVTVAIAILVPALIWQLASVFFGLSDLFATREVEGELLRKRLFKTGQWLPDPIERAWYSSRASGDHHAGMTREAQRKRRRYLAVDTGEHESVTAWKVKPRVHSSVTQGARVRARVTPRLGYVREIETLTPAPRRERSPLGETTREVADLASSKLDQVVERLGGRMADLAELRDEEGRPVLEHTDDDGVTLRERLADVSEQLDDARSQAADEPVARGLLDRVEKMMGDISGGGPDTPNDHSTTHSEET